MEHTEFAQYGGEQIPFYSVQEWQDNFDELFDRVENGRETIGIYDGTNRAIMIPIDSELAQHITVEQD